MIPIIYSGIALVLAYSLMRMLIPVFCANRISVVDAPVCTHDDAAAYEQSLEPQGVFRNSSRRKSVDRLKSHHWLTVDGNTRSVVNTDLYRFAPVVLHRDESMTLL